MKKIVIFLFILSFFTITPLKNYHDLERVIFVTLILVDKNSHDEYSIYYECFKPTTSTKAEQKEGEKTVLHVNVNNVSDLLNELNTKSNLELDLSQTRMILFTNRAAEDGIDEVLNVFTHYQHFVIGCQIALLDNRPQLISNVNLKGEMYLGPYLTTQLKQINLSVGNSSEAIIKRVYNESSIGSNTTFIPIVDIQGDTGDTKVHITGLAILKNYKLIGKLNNLESIHTNFLLNNIKSTSIVAINPENLHSTVALRVMKCKVSTKANYNKGKFIITKDIVVNCIYRGSENKLNLTDENIKKIEKSAADILIKNCYNVFKENQDKNIDIMKVRDTVYRHYPHINEKDILKKSQLILNVKICLESSRDPRDFTD